MIERFVEILPDPAGRISSYKGESSCQSEIIMHFTVEEAERNTREAIDLYIESLQAYNRAIPFGRDGAIFINSQFGDTL